LGQLWRLDGRADEAVAAFEASLRLDPSSRFAIVGLAHATAQLTLVSVDRLCEQYTALSVLIGRRDEDDAVPAIHVAIKLLRAIEVRTGWTELADLRDSLALLIDRAVPNWLDEAIDRLDLARRFVQAHRGFDSVAA
jgi:tetratricopeptide (TPR) repeat protein